MVAQLTGPPKALWKAGHDSVTLRNRRELGLLQQTLRSQSINLYHFVVPYFDPSDPGASNIKAPEPLNWSLTEAEKKEIGDKLKLRANTLKAIAKCYSDLATSPSTATCRN